jgi:hypothetical protein
VAGASTGAPHIEEEPAAMQLTPVSSVKNLDLRVREELFDQGNIAVVDILGL